MTSPSRMPATARRTASPRPSSAADSPRWGDYGAAAVDPANGHLWIASEDIHQSCTLDEYVASGATCGNTRTALANWSTQISEIVR